MLRLCLFLLTPSSKEGLSTPFLPLDTPENVCHLTPRPPQWATRKAGGCSWGPLSRGAQCRRHAGGSASPLGCPHPSQIWRGKGITYRAINHSPNDIHSRGPSACTKASARPRDTPQMNEMWVLSSGNWKCSQAEPCANSLGTSERGTQSDHPPMLWGSALP